MTNFDLRRGEEKGKKKKENGRFHKSDCIRRLTDKYRQAVPVSPAPPIFIGEDTSQTNIGHVYLSMMWLHGRIYGADQSQIGRPIYLLVLAQTDEYNFIFVGFETDEYNLNIFVGIDEYKKIGE
jgi:hypothetical protein